MGEAKRRRKLDPNFGREFFVSVQKSDLTDKWLVIVHLFGVKRVISPHYKKKDAEAASQIVQSVFSQYSPEELQNSELWSKALQSLNYEDDDEPLGTLKLAPDGSPIIDTTESTMKNMGAVFREHELFSDAAKQAFKEKWKDKPDRSNE
jgi:hypothetical protein